MNVYFKASLLLLSVTIAHAGDMGDAGDMPINYLTTPFIVAEGSLNHAEYANEVFNNVYGTQLNNHWGGRFGAGITREYRGQFSLTSEIGYGYYGRVRTSFPNNVNNNYYAIDGVDALVGALYILRQLDIFFKAGAMIENKRVKGSLDLSKAYPGGVGTGTQNYNSNFTQVLPALKTGAMYNFNNNVAISLSYMHVFGSTTSLINNTSVASSPVSIVSTTNMHNQNPTVDSVLLGLQYNLT